MHRKFWSENLKERDHLEYLGVYGWIMLQWFIEILVKEVVYWNLPAQK
jgi:hypothetical protein